MNMEGTDLCLVRPCPEHFPELLRISKGIYDGSDYIEQTFFIWLEQELQDPKKRRNVILTDDRDSKTRVLGYQSFYFQEDGREVVSQALRLDPQFRGQGLGRRFMELCSVFLTRIAPDLKFELKTIWHQYLSEGKHRDPKLGAVLATRVSVFYWTEDVKYFLKSLEKIKSEHEEEFIEITASQLGKIFEEDEDRFVKTLLDGGQHLLVKWVPFELRRGRHVEVIKPLEGKMRFLMQNTPSKMSLSLLTLPTKAEIGFNVGLDIYADDEEQFLSHSKLQLEALARNSQGFSSSGFQLNFACGEKFFGLMERFMRENLDLKLTPKYDPNVTGKLPIYNFYRKALK